MSATTSWPIHYIVYTYQCMTEIWHSLCCIDLILVKMKDYLKLSVHGESKTSSIISKLFLPWYRNEKLLLEEPIISTGGPLENQGGDGDLLPSDNRCLEQLMRFNARVQALTNLNNIMLRTTWQTTQFGKRTLYLPLCSRLWGTLPNMALTFRHYKPMHCYCLFINTNVFNWSL